jgi:hypothetical protein
MNTMSVHDLHSDEDFPISTGHDNSNIGNVQAPYHEELENPLVVDVKVVHDDAFVIEMHLEISQKQNFLWKPY